MLIFGVGVFDEKAGPDNKVPRAYWSDGPLIEGPLYARNGTHSLHSNSGF